MMEGECRGVLNLTACASFLCALYGQMVSDGVIWRLERAPGRTSISSSNLRPEREGRP